jgi:hypothetical protein
MLKSFPSDIDIAMNSTPDIEANSKKLDSSVLDHLQMVV